MNIGIKDNIAVAGLPMTCGSPILENHAPSYDATVVSKLLDEGAAIVGKTNMDEFAFDDDSHSMRFKLARNPNEPTHRPGGSSSGSVVAVVEDDVDAALGTDTGGSVLIPAAYSGAVGVKPTRGLVSHHGFVQFSKILDNIGPLARTVKDAAKVLEVIAGEDPKDERTYGHHPGEYVAAVEAGHSEPEVELTIGVVDDMFGGLYDHSPDVDSVVRQALEQLKRAGADVREVELPKFRYGYPAWLNIAYTEMRAYFRAKTNNYWFLTGPEPELVAAVQEAFQTRIGALGERITNTILVGEHFNEAYGDLFYAYAKRAQRALMREHNEVMSEIDVIASPTTPSTAQHWDDTVPPEKLIEDAKNTSRNNLTGAPAISLPCGQVDGLPVGIMFTGARFDELTIFKIGGHWESIFSG